MANATSMLRRLAETLRRRRMGAAYGTYEQVPGRGIGHLEELIEAPYDERAAFTLDPRSTWNRDGKDVLYSALGYATQPSRGMIGAFTPKAGGLEINPGMAAPLDVPVDPSGRARALEDMRKAESARAYIDAQNAGAGHMVLPLRTTPEAERTSLVIERGDSPSRDEMAELVRLAGDYGFFPVDTGRGMSFINNPFSPQGESRTAESAINAAEAMAAEVPTTLLPEITPARMESVYEEYEPLFRSRGTGAATRKFLDDIMADERVAAALEPELMRKAEANLVRDVEKQRTSGYAVREDIQRARQILSRSGLTGLKQALESGAILPAAAAAILLDDDD